MKKILFIYDSMMTGGTSTALLSLMNSIDRTRYEISLLLYSNSGQHMKDIPQYVKLLPPAYKGKNINHSSRRKIVRTVLNGQIVKAVFSYFKYKGTPKGKMRNILMHYGMKAQVSLSRDILEPYDYAIGFMEGWANQYVVSSKINANKRFVWIHPQYKNCYLIPEIDRSVFKKANGIALVSDNCMSQFLEFFNEFIDKTKVVPNIIATELIRQKSKAQIVHVEKKKINLCSVSRCDMYVKGLDRILNVLHTLKLQGFCEDVLFHFIGGGADLERFRQEVKKLELDDIVITYGNQMNPLPYLLHMDAFILASRYEGKPVSVTEAQILGVPCLVTDYESAKSQVAHNYNGWIMENSEDSIYESLKMILQNPTLLEKWKTNMETQDFGNEKDVSIFYGFLEQ